MIEQEKQLLLADLCARLPYNVRIRHYVNDIDFYSNPLMTYDIDQLENNKAIIKPYLRPMSSMTEEEEVIYEQLIKDVHYKPRESTCCKLISWLNENYFDYNYLIEKGLAIAVTDDNNPYKE